MTGVREMHQSHTLLWVLRNNNEIKCSMEERLIMKRMKNFKKVAVSLMAAVMCFGVAGCNKTTSEEVPTGDVYSPVFSEISSDIEYVSNVLSDGNKIQVIGQVYDNVTYEMSQKLITIDAATGETNSKDMVVDSDKKDENENVSLQTISSYKDGYMAVRYHYTQPSQEEIDSGAYEAESSYDIAILDSDFNIQSAISLDELQKKVEEDSGNFYVQYATGDAEGNIYITLDNVMYVLDPDGKQKFKIDFDNWINGVIATSDGQVVVMYYDDKYEMAVAKVDLDAKAVGAPLENVPSMEGGSSSIFPAGDGRLYMAGSTKLYLYDMNTQTSEEVLDWVDCDINTNNLSGFAVLEDSSFVALSTTYDYSGDDTQATIELATIKKVPASSVKQKKNITLAMLSMNYNMREQVIRFNRANDEYRINIKTYVNDDYSNLDEAQTQFKADVAAGTAGDFFISDSNNVDVNNLIAKGALADLTDLIYKDADLSRDYFIPNILDILSVNGKLYSVAESFNIQTIVGRVSDVGSGKSWTFKDIMELAKKHPDASLFQYTTKSDGLASMVIYSMDSFYNSETGECKFDSDDFISLLELCNTFPKEIDYDSTNEVSLPSLLRSGKVLLTSLYMSDFSEIQLYNKLYGEPVNFIGYPTNSGSGSVVGFTNRFCIPAKSKNKDGAWAFIRNFLLPDAQSKLDWNLPVSKEAFEQKITDEMNAKDADENGVVNTWWYDDTEIEIGALTEEEAQTIRDIVYGATSEASYDQDLLNIISEEAEYYFNGEKSAQEIAGIIQSRAQLYIDENR